MSAQPQQTASKPVDERLCNHCGKCCYKKIIVGRTVFITPFPCEYLNTDTNLCTIYERRHELNPYCLSVPEGMKVSAFPSDCPYVPEHAPPGYRPARDDHDWGAEWHDLDNLARDLEVPEATLEKVRARGPDAPPMHVEAFARIQQQLIWGGNGPQIVDARSEPPAKAPSIAAMARDASTQRRAR
ncbi:MAG TPA: hypothetical protein VEJ63_08790 [Planctomycetota bacterium]|nr:hypothetical protein [Planctomycetota bacterium]